MMSTDWRALCEELADTLERAQRALRFEGGCSDTTDNKRRALIARARAALAQPEPEVVGPTLQLPEQAPDEHPPSNLDRREAAAWYHGHYCGWQAARTALAAEADGPAVQSREPASVACEPSDGDLLQLMPEQFRADLGTVSRMAAHGAGPDIKPGLFRVILNTGALEYARAVLARWGSCQGILDSSAAPTPAEGEVASDDIPLGPFSEHDLQQQWNQQADEFNKWDSLDSYEQLEWAQARAIAADRARWGRPAPVPAEGEVAELVAALRADAECAEVEHYDLCNMTADQMRRAAELLERQAAPVPVAVSERLPGAGDCLGRPTEDSDAGWCWTYSGALEVWRFQSVVFPRPYPEPPRVTLSPSVTHWLPANALPLPSGEVEHG